MKHAKQIERPWQPRRALWLLLALALALRAGLAMCTAGYKYDVNCFFAWALRMAETGPRGFYAADYFCDYPPAYLYVLWFVGKGMKLLGLTYLQKGAALLLTLLPSLADCALAALLYGIALPRHGARVALWMAGAAAFCPVLLYDTAVWKQIDGFFALWLVLCFALLEAGQAMPTRGRCCAAALCYGVALAVKPQALLAGPVLALCFLRPILGGKTARQRLAACGTAGLGVGCALAPVLACALPFYGFSDLAAGLAERYLTTTQSYPYASIDAFNWMAFLGGNWAAQTDRVGALPLTWQQLGWAGLALLTAYTVCLAVRAARRGQFSALLLAAFYMIGVFTVSHRMHERYLIPGVLLLVAAAALAGSRRLLVLAQGFGLTALLDLAVVYTNVGGEDQFLTGAVSTQLMRAAGLAETVLFALLAATVWQVCSGRVLAPLAVKPRPDFVAAPAPQPRWTRAEAAGLAALTLAVAAVSFYGLGDTTAPQTCVDANGTTYIAQLNVEGEAAALWVYPGISSDNKGHLTVTDAAGEVVLEKELNYTAPFAWSSTLLGTGSPYYTVTVEDGQIFELAFRDASGALLAVREQVLDAGGAQGAGSLCDEAALVPDTISYKNSFYFDEIYHARTGYELLHGMHIYETTHPPLGKDFIALGIALFGMTAFGWRFFGTLFGVLLVPLVYLLVRRLLRKPWLAGVAAGLMALDFLRFAQSRLATIDTYATFFILLGALFMLWYAQRALTHGVGGALLPMALGGVAFGLGCAAKWTGVYAGAGLAVLYFGVLARRYAQLHATMGADGCALGPSQRSARHSRWRRELRLALGGGVLFYVLVPLGLYLAAYLPYRAGNASFGLREWWACQLSMFRYHSTLDATHPFSSSWYAWLGDLRPVWYYQGKGLAAGQYASIAGFVSPVLAWCGLAAILWLLARQAGARGTAAGGFVLVCYGSNLLPWLLVTRCTFLYHYFPCLPSLAAAIALALNDLAHKNERRARGAALALLGAAAGLFVWFYPVLAGVPVSGAWAASLKWLPSWGFYIL